MILESTFAKRVLLTASLAVTALIVGCSGGATAPADPAASIDGAWSGVTSQYSALHIELAERADDHRLFGTWTGARTHCTGACVDSGIVVDGVRANAAVTFRVTAINGTRSLLIDGTFDGIVIRATASFTDDGAKSDPESMTLRR